MIFAWTMFIVGLVFGFMVGLTWVTWLFAIAAKEQDPSFVRNDWEEESW